MADQQHEASQPDENQGDAFDSYPAGQTATTRLIAEVSEEVKEVSPQAVVSESVDVFAFPKDFNLADAQFIKVGDDLLVQTEGELIVVEGYFAAGQTSPPKLVDSGGVVFPHDLILAFLEIQDSVPDSKQPSSNQSIAAGVVSEVSGEVYLIRDYVPRLIQNGDIVLMGDVIHAKDDGVTRIEMNDGSVMALASGARLRIDEFIYSGDDSNSDSTVLSLIKGQLLYLSGKIAQNNYEAVQIQSLTNNIAVRGTSFGFQVDPNDRDSGVKVVLLSGSVSVGDADEKIILDQPFSKIDSAFKDPLQASLVVDPSVDVVEALQLFAPTLVVAGDEVLARIGAEISEQRGAPFDLEEALRETSRIGQSRDVSQTAESAESPLFNLSPQSVQTNPAEQELAEDENQGGDVKPMEHYGTVAKGNQLVANFEDQSVDLPPFFAPAVPKLVQLAEESSTTVGQIKAFAVKGHEPTYRLEGEDANLFVIDQEGSLSLRRPVDYEKPADENGDNVYQVSVVARASNGLESSHSLSVQVMNRNDEKPSVVDPQRPVGEVAEGKPANVDGLAIGFIKTSDPDSDPSDLTVVKIDDPSGLFTITPEGQLRFKGLDTQTDYEQQDLYTLKISVGDGQNFVVSDIKVKINNIDDSSPVAPSFISVTVDENLSAGSALVKILASDSDTASEDLRYSLQVDDQSRVSELFEIDPKTGVLSLKPGQTLDFEQGMPDEQGLVRYQMTVLVTDGVNKAAIVGVSVSVRDVDDTAPWVPTTDATVLADGINEDLVTAKKTDQGVELSIKESFHPTALDDPSGRLIRIESRDLDLSSKGKLDYKLSLNTLNLFVLEQDGDAAYLRLRPDANFDYESLKAEGLLTAEISATDGQLTSEGSLVVNVRVVDQDDVAPFLSFVDHQGNALSSEVSVTTISESASRDTIVASAKALDEDTPSTPGSMTYWLQDDHDGLFRIDADTGVISLTREGVLDYESGPRSYDLKVLVSDGSQASQPALLTVQVEDADDTAPTNVGVITQNGHQVDVVVMSEDAPMKTVVAYLGATDVDSPEGITYQVFSDQKGTLSKHFEAQGSQLVLIRSLDSETLENLELTVYLKAIDGSGNESELQPITVRITTVDNIPPMIDALSEDRSVAIREDVGSDESLFEFRVSDADTPLRYYAAKGEDGGDLDDLSLADVFTVQEFDEQKGYVNSDRFYVRVADGSNGKDGLFSVVPVPDASLDHENEQHIKLKVLLNTVIVGEQGVQVDDSAPVSLDFEINVEDVNDNAPHSVTIRNTSVTEGIRAGEVITDFIVTDLDTDADQGSSVRLQKIIAYYLPDLTFIPPEPRDVTSLFRIDDQNRLILLEGALDADGLVSDEHPLRQLKSLTVEVEAFDGKNISKSFTLQIAINDNPNDDEASIGDIFDANDQKIESGKVPVIAEGEYNDQDSTQVATIEILGLPSGENKLTLDTHSDLFEADLVETTGGSHELVISVVQGAKLDFETRQYHELAFSISSLSSGKGLLSFEQRIQIADRDDALPNPPRFTEINGDLVRTVVVAETVGSDSPLLVVRSVDPDTRQAFLQYKVYDLSVDRIDSGNELDGTTIVPGTYPLSDVFEVKNGQLFLKEGASLDYDAGQQFYGLLITATDGTNPESAASFLRVNLSDEIDIPPQLEDFRVITQPDFVVDDGVTQETGGSVHRIKVSEEISTADVLATFKLSTEENQNTQLKALILGGDNRFNALLNPETGLFELKLSTLGGFPSSLDYESGDKNGMTLEIKGSILGLYSEPYKIVLELADANDNAPSGIRAKVSEDAEWLQGNVLSSVREDAATEEGGSGRYVDIAYFELQDVDEVDLPTRTLEVISIVPVGGQVQTDLKDSFQLFDQGNGLAILKLRPGVALDYETLGRELEITLRGWDDPHASPHDSVEQVFVLGIENVDDTPPAIFSLERFDANGNSRLIDISTSVPEDIVAQDILTPYYKAGPQGEGQKILSLTPSDRDAQGGKQAGFDFQYRFEKNPLGDALQIVETIGTDGSSSGVLRWNDTAGPADNVYTLQTQGARVFDFYGLQDSAGRFPEGISVVPYDADDPDGLSMVQVQFSVAITSTPQADNPIVSTDANDTTLFQPLTLTFLVLPVTSPTFEIRSLGGTLAQDQGGDAVLTVSPSVGDQGYQADVAIARLTTDDQANRGWKVQYEAFLTNQAGVEILSSDNLKITSDGLVLIKSHVLLSAQHDPRLQGVDALKLVVRARYDDSVLPAEAERPEEIFATDESQFGVSLVESEDTSALQSAQFTFSLNAGLNANNDFQLDLGAVNTISVTEGVDLSAAQSDGRYVKLGQFSATDADGAALSHGGMAAHLFGVSREGVFRVDHNGGLWVDSWALREIDSGFYSEGGVFSGKVSLSFTDASTGSPVVAHIEDFTLTVRNSPKEHLPPMEFRSSGWPYAVVTESSLEIDSVTIDGRTLYRGFEIPLGGIDGLGELGALISDGSIAVRIVQSSVTSRATQSSANLEQAHVDLLNKYIKVDASGQVLLTNKIDANGNYDPLAGETVPSMRTDLFYTQDIENQIVSNQGILNANHKSALTFSLAIQNKDTGHELLGNDGQPVRIPVTLRLRDENDPPILDFLLKEDGSSGIEGFGVAAFLTESKATLVTPSPAGDGSGSSETVILREAGNVIPFIFIVSDDSSGGISPREYPFRLSADAYVKDPATGLYSTTSVASWSGEDLLPHLEIRLVARAEENGQSKMMYQLILKDSASGLFDAAPDRNEPIIRLSVRTFDPVDASRSNELNFHFVKFGSGAELATLIGSTLNTIISGTNYVRNDPANDVMNFPALSFIADQKFMDTTSLDSDQLQYHPNVAINPDSGSGSEGNRIGKVIYRADEERGSFLLKIDNVEGLTEEHNGRLNENHFDISEDFSSATPEHRVFVVRYVGSLGDLVAKGVFKINYVIYDDLSGNSPATASGSFTLAFSDVESAFTLAEGSVFVDDADPSQVDDSGVRVIDLNSEESGDEDVLIGSLRVSGVVDPEDLSVKLSSFDAGRYRWVIQNVPDTDEVLVNFYASRTLLQGDVDGIIDFQGTLQLPSSANGLSTRGFSITTHVLQDIEVRFEADVTNAENGHVDQVSRLALDEGFVVGVDPSGRTTIQIKETLEVPADQVAKLGNFLVSGSGQSIQSPELVVQNTLGEEVSDHPFTLIESSTARGGYVLAVKSGESLDVDAPDGALSHYTISLVDANDPQKKVLSTVNLKVIPVDDVATQINPTKVAFNSDESAVLLSLHVSDVDTSPEHYDIQVSLSALQDSNGKEHVPQIRLIETVIDEDGQGKTLNFEITGQDWIDGVRDSGQFNATMTTLYNGGQTVTGETTTQRFVVEASESGDWVINFAPASEAQASMIHSVDFVTTDAERVLDLLEDDDPAGGLGLPHTGDQDVSSEHQGV